MQISPSLNQYQIGLLLQSQTNTCPHCDYSQMTYFCIDKCCLKRSLTCFSCSQTDIRHPHYLHEIVDAKTFILEDYPLIFQKLVDQFSSFREKISLGVQSCESLLSMLKDFEKELDNHTKKLSEELSLSGVFELISKMNNIKCQEDEKVNIQSIFSAYSFYRPDELLKKVEKLDIKKKIGEIQKFKLDIKYQTSYESLLTKLKKYKLNEFIPFNSAKMLHINPDIRSLKIDLYSIPREFRKLCLLNYKKIHTLELNNKIDHAGLNEVLLIFPSLKRLKFQHENPYYDKQSPLQHQNLQTLHFDYYYQLNEMFLRDFFTESKFPSLQKIVIENFYHASSHKEFIRLNLQNIFEQDFSRIRSFELIREGREEFTQETKESILKFVGRNQFFEVVLRGVNWTPLQKVWYKATAERKNLLLRSYTFENMPLSNEKLIFYSVLQYQRCKYISKRTFKNMLLNLLIPD